MPGQRVRVIKDFLPAPGDPVPRDDNVKVTLSLSRRSRDFFKRDGAQQAAKVRTRSPRITSPQWGEADRQSAATAAKGRLCPSPTGERDTKNRDAGRPQSPFTH